MTKISSNTNIWASVLAVILITAANFNKSLAQEMKTHKGSVLSSDTTLLLKNIQIKNVNTGLITLSDFYGQFTIQYTTGDTIEFKHKNWDPKLLVANGIKDSIFLTRRSIVIDEVEITATRIHTSLRDLEMLETDLNKKNGIYYEGRPPLALLNPFGGKPITFFYELLSKGGRVARKMNSTIQSEYERNEVDKIFNARTIRTVIDIEERDLERFILQFRPTLEEVNSWTDYDFQVYIKKSFKAFTTD